MNDIKAMNQAWATEKAKNPHTAYNSWCRGFEAALSQPEQEPVLWKWSGDGWSYEKPTFPVTPLYTAPPSKPCAIADMVQQKFQSGNNVPVERVTITRSAYEAALRSKNNG